MDVKFWIEDAEHNWSNWLGPIFFSWGWQGSTMSRLGDSKLRGGARREELCLGERGECVGGGACVGVCGCHLPPNAFYSTHPILSDSPALDHTIISNPPSGAMACALKLGWLVWARFKQEDQSWELVSGVGCSDPCMITSTWQSAERQLLTEKKWMETLMRSDLSIAFLAKWARTGDYGKKVGNGSSQCETCNSGFDVASSASITKHDCSSIQLNT